MKNPKYDFDRVLADIAQNLSGEELMEYRAELEEEYTRDKQRQVNIFEKEEV
ncbi:MAG: hypothetical protein GX985_08370 [Gallicola sp.]|nr:hypothetical protein [Gallicola sp.]